MDRLPLSLLEPASEFMPFVLIWLLVFLLPFHNSAFSKNLDGAEKAKAPGSIVMAAGVPKSLGESENYEKMMSELRAGGISVFMPFSEYQELPESKSLGYEVDFYPQFKRSDRALEALKKHKIRLMVPGEILYPEGKMPALKDDPLRKLLSWAGRGNVYGVFSYDEPVSRTYLAKCKALYTRVKEIDESLPVIMIHAPVPESYLLNGKQVEPKSEADIGKYFSQVKNYSQYADIVGFDIYAIPKELMKVVGPCSSSREVFLDYREAEEQYLSWLKKNLPLKQRLLVLQAFCLKDQGHPPLLAALYGDRRPSPAELQDMVQIARRHGALISWWGQSLLKDQSGMEFWQEILKASKP